jgi:hypothetical protein
MPRRKLLGMTIIRFASHPFSLGMSQNGHIEETSLAIALAFAADGAPSPASWRERCTTRRFGAAGIALDSKSRAGLNKVLRTRSAFLRQKQKPRKLLSSPPCLLKLRSGATATFCSSS